MKNVSQHRLINISLSEQRLQLREGEQVLMDVAISTARNGPGEQVNSECTPRGWHQVRAMIGGDAVANTVFVGRRPSGEIFSPELKRQSPERDWILTRILWLSGLTPGENRLGSVDTMRRYIYIHGCPDEDIMGVPSSHGCIKMRNAEVIDLFNTIEPGTRVWVGD